MPKCIFTVSLAGHGDTKGEAWCDARIKARDVRFPDYSFASWAFPEHIAARVPEGFVERAYELGGKFVALDESTGSPVVRVFDINQDEVLYRFLDFPVSSHHALPWVELSPPRPDPGRKCILERML
jgi:hypothetical protein